MILRVLKIPPGTSWRKGSSKTGGTAPAAVDNEYVQAMVDITVDDICIGDEPLSLDCDTTTPQNIKEKFNQICKECNDIVKWAAKDLCLKGYSVYDAKINKLNRLVLIPHIQGVEFYMTPDKEIVVYEAEAKNGNKKKQLKDVLVFISFDRDSLVEIEDNDFKKFVYGVNPAPMQLKNATKAVNDLNATEQAILRYRVIASRVARWINVDVGLSQGDKQNDSVETISAAINANSLSLTPTSDQNEFDDNIPVLPNRRGIGKPEIQESKMDVNIKDVADLDYLLGKLNLCMRFPGSYIDFSKELNGTAVSTIRGDIRYAKMIKSVASKLVKTLNDFVNASEIFSKYHPAFLLTSVPTPEDEDVLAALEQYVDLAEKIENFVMGEDSTNQQRLYRLQMLQELYAGTAMSPQLQKWFEMFRQRIRSMAEASGETLEDPEDATDNPNTDDSIDFDFDEEAETSGSGIENEPEVTDLDTTSEDVEFIEPQTE